MKKKLITVDQLNGLIPVLIDGKLYCVGKSKSGKDLILTGRDKVNLEFTGEKETILEGEKELYNYSLGEENNKYFSFVDMSWSYDSEEPFAMKAYVFDKENLDNVLKVNQDNIEADYKAYVRLWDYSRRELLYAFYTS